MEKKFKSGDIIYDKNLEEYGKFIDYTNDTECKIEVIINNVIERHCADYKNLCFATVENVCQHLEKQKDMSICNMIVRFEGKVGIVVVTSQI